METLSKRDNVLDIAKGLSILLMTITHLDLFNDYPNIIDFNREVLMLFKMPLFIFISGVLFKSNSNNFNSFFKSKFDGLIKPILSIYILTFLIVLVFILFNSSSKDIISIIKLTHLDTIRFFIPLWFPISLFITLIIIKGLFLLKNNYKDSIVYMTCMSLLFLLFYLQKVNVGFSLIKLSTIYYFVIIFAFGYIFKKRNHFKLFYRGDIALFSIILFSLCISGKFFFEINFDLFENSFGKTLPTIITFICGISITIYLSKFLSKISYLSGFLIKCSKASFFILALHILLGNYFLGPIFKNYIDNTLLCNFLTFTLTIFTCIFLYKYIFKTKFIKYLFIPNKAIR